MSRQNVSVIMIYCRLQKPRIEKDRSDVNAFVELMEKSWVNRLGPDQSDIISLSTGISVSPETYDIVSTRVNDE